MRELQLADDPRRRERPGAASSMLEDGDDLDAATRHRVLPRLRRTRIDADAFAEAASAAAGPGWWRRRSPTTKACGRSASMRVMAPSHAAITALERAAGRAGRNPRWLRRRLGLPAGGRHRALSGMERFAVRRRACLPGCGHAGRQGRADVRRGEAFARGELAIPDDAPPPRTDPHARPAAAPAAGASARSAAARLRQRRRSRGLHPCHRAHRVQRDRPGLGRGVPLPRHAARSSTPTGSAWPTTRRATSRCCASGCASSAATTATSTRTTACGKWPRRPRTTAWRAWRWCRACWKRAAWT